MNVPVPRAIVSTEGNFLNITPAGAARITGDVRISDPIVIGNVTVSVDVTGDTTATQNAGDSYRVNQTGAWANAITGDVSTFPRGGDVWPVREQGITGVQIVGGQVGGSHGVTGDVSLQQSTDRIIGRIAGPTGVNVVGTTSRLPISGDTVLVDGADTSIKGTVRDYANSNPIAVVPTNTRGDAIPDPSGDRSYWNETIDVTASGDTTLHTPASGRKFYVESIVFTVGSSGEVQFKSGTTKITGPMNFLAYGGIAMDHGLSKLRGRAINDALILTVSNAATLDVGGYVTGYDE